MIIQLVLSFLVGFLGVFCFYEHRDKVEVRKVKDGAINLLIKKNEEIELLEVKLGELKDKAKLQ